MKNKKTIMVATAIICIIGALIVSVSVYLHQKQIHQDGSCKTSVLTVDSIDQKKGETVTVCP